MNGALKYIEQNIADAKFSKIFYLQNNAAGVVEKNFADVSARAILLHYIYWVTVAAGAVPVIWSDQFGSTIFSQFNFVGTGWAPIYKVEDGQQLRISCNVLTQRWFLSFQYIM